MTPSSGLAARFEAVSKRFGAVRALDGVDFEIGRAETVALLGPNGAGKSTTIGLLLGMQKADAGRVSVLGDSPERAVASGRVAAMLQEGGLPQGATVAELVGFVRQLYPRPLPLGETLALAGLEDLAGRRVERLSGGQAQRVRFALAMAGNPELAFLDEPTTGMDVEARRAFWDRMRSFAAEGRTVLFATHYLEEADAVADRIVVLQRGRVIADGAATAIKARTTQRFVRCTLPGADEAMLRSLPGVTDLSRHGDVVRLTTGDADATVQALYAGGLAVRDLEVTGAGLEEAFLSLIGGTR
ncbi:MAG TPA: ABC transporter ATP-binding protein [Actinomycetota bacterium]|jgi:ABC-2 type transport system ATP-binding protein|nr:ABC transporter ATP-binding protein [Actinomycetota bacterium]